jgi:hypothetical protein
MFNNELRELERAEQTTTNAPNHDDMPQNSFWVQLNYVRYEERRVGAVAGPTRRAGIPTTTSATPRTRATWPR